MTQPMPTRDVMGLKIPLPLAARMIASIRATYPTVVEGLDDDAAVQAVVRHWFTSTLVSYESTRANDLAQKAVRKAVEAAQNAANLAAQAALADAESQITEVTE